MKSKLIELLKSVDVVTPNGDVRGQRPSRSSEFLAYSVNEENEDDLTAQSVVSVETTLQLYLDHKCAKSDILVFWKKNKALFLEGEIIRKLMELN